MIFICFEDNHLLQYIINYIKQYEKLNLLKIID